MTILPDMSAYFESLADELISQYNRVRHLIGDKHWLSDGHHKEYLLTSLLKRHTPANVLVSRGFVTNPGTPNGCSKEQDILVVDTRYQAPLFNQGGLIVAQPKTVIASISVKTKMKSTTIDQTIENQNSVRKVYSEIGLTPHQFMSIGYFFEKDEVVTANPACIYEYYDKGINRHAFFKTSPNIATAPLPGPELLCCGADLVYIVNHETCNTEKLPKPRILGYECSGLATAVFLATIIDYIAAALESNDTNVSQLVENSKIRQLTPPSYTLTMNSP